ncbi:MAG: hypothetical protein [Bacteriophage sp.]|nr:MAG: hypothetical protein [Bacteriophage sp.]
MTTKYDKSRVRNDLTEAGNWAFNALSLVMNDMAFGLDQLSEQDISSLINAHIRLNETVKDIRKILGNLEVKEDNTHA